MAKYEKKEVTPGTAEGVPAAPPLPSQVQAPTSSHTPTIKNLPEDAYVWATNGPGRAPVRFTRASWEKMQGDRGGYKQVAKTPPEVLALMEEKGLS
jgi:hypothetical protein